MNVNVSYSVDDFVERINSFILERGSDKKLVIEPDMHLLTRDEVVGLRLYTGPAYQPLNEWLRNAGKLSPGLRRSMVLSPGLTYAATTKHIVSGIRNLSRVGNQKLDVCTLYRGLGGKLPDHLWHIDREGIVCATDLGFMSTSLNDQTLIHYMQSNSQNLRWEIKHGKEDNVAFHCGAVISALSQYEGEDEVLFPPLTMLRVRQRREHEGIESVSSMEEPWGVTCKVYAFMS